MYKVPVLQSDGKVDGITVIERDFDRDYSEFAKNLPVGVELCDTLESIKAKLNLHIICSLMEFDEAISFTKVVYDSYFALFNEQDSLVISEEYYKQRMLCIVAPPKKEKKPNSTVAKIAKLLVPDPA